MDKYSTLWRRFAAAIIDSIILWPTGVLNNYLVAIDNKYLFAIGSLVLPTVYCAYFIIMHGRYGQTVGKKFARVKVSDLNEISLIGIKRATIRELPWIIGYIIVFIYQFIPVFITRTSDLQKATESYNNLIFFIFFPWILTEFVITLTNHKRRAIHDYMAKSVVIKNTNYLAALPLTLAFALHWTPLPS